MHSDIKCSICWLNDVFVLPRAGVKHKELKPLLSGACVADEVLLLQVIKTTSNQWKTEKLWGLCPMILQNKASEVPSWSVTQKHTSTVNVTVKTVNMPHVQYSDDSRITIRISKKHIEALGEFLTRLTPCSHYYVWWPSNETGHSSCDQFPYVH